MRINLKTRNGFMSACQSAKLPKVIYITTFFVFFISIFDCEKKEEKNENISLIRLNIFHLRLFY